MAGGDEHGGAEVFEAAGGAVVVGQGAVGGERLLPAAQGAAGFAARPPHDAHGFADVCATVGIAAVAGQGLSQFQAVLGGVESALVDVDDGHVDQRADLARYVFAREEPPGGLQVGNHSV
ncbi:hypothetical protein NONI108955_44755 [Nocardia ninae]